MRKGDTPAMSSNIRPGKPSPAQERAWAELWLMLTAPRNEPAQPQQAEKGDR